MNRKLSGIETFILFTEPEHTHISSSIVRELLRYGKDISQFVPKGTNPLLKNKTMKRILLPLLILSVFAASMSAQRGNNIDAASSSWPCMPSPTYM